MTRVYLSPIRTAETKPETTWRVTTRGWVVLGMFMLLVAIGITHVTANYHLICDWRQGVTPCQIMTTDELLDSVFPATVGTEQP